MITYDEQTIAKVFALLDKLTITGIDNAKRIALIDSLLHQTKEDTNGDDKV